jgi:hypothetical protein
VTDAGIYGLCVIGECKLIEYLDLRRTKVTSEGVIMALQNLSSLTVLEHDTVTEALHEIHKLGALENKLKDLSKFSLSNISICASNIPWWNWEKFLKLTVFLCPSITQVNFRGDYDSFDDSILLELLPLEKLERLNVDGLISNADCPLSFLKERGSSLKHLHISVVHEDYIPLIAQYCPNLRSLSLSNVILEEGDSDIDDYANVIPQVRRQRNKLMLKQPIFKYLEKLTLFNLHEMLRESICLLLLSPSLKYVDIHYCATFTDDVLQRATNAHSFPNLVSFEMSNCELATHKILDILLLQDNVSDHLNSIKLEWWKQNEPSNFDQIIDNWRKMKEKNRWDLKIWLGYKFDYVYNKGKGPFEYSSDEETDEDKIIKNKIIII